MVRGQHDPILCKIVGTIVRRKEGTARRRRISGVSSRDGDGFTSKYLIGGCSHDCDGGRWSLVSPLSLLVRGRGAFSTFNLQPTIWGEDLIFRGY